MTAATATIDFQPATEDDFERLLDLRIRVLRPHLERVGRFDPERARRYFRAGYDPTHLRLILVDGGFAGCVALKPAGDGLELEHFYLDDAMQGRGVGGAVLARLTGEADAAGLPIRLGVLKGSPAARLYRRHGFVWTHDEPYDDYYLRSPGGDDTRP
ncbi:N-acetyltransferase [Thalassobaculum fulvum]|uniref:N-acetyltransferase n=1 Tax=Thalassobaculum fulvum TaxID=1633335 RepID=A0A918XT02_9PROT|nr:GNAT family N-acetyltransferase [Thalassobaculum fulvum]GHD53717.1 N-acetyltransferase [Thalassobaculum fulvum]